MRAPLAAGTAGVPPSAVTTRVPPARSSRSTVSRPSDMASSSRSLNDE
ncbi:MAG: hypothetical protein IPH09_18170 [bacterium]|nr:hypothetical protein [bacterium]